MNNYHRIWLSLAVAMLAAPVTADPPLRRVVTDLRVTSTRVQNALPAALISEVRKRVAALIADTGRENYGYLEWVPLPAAESAGVPLVALEVFDEAAGPSSFCSAKVRWRLVGETNAKRLILTSGELDNGCNPRPRFRGGREFEEDLAKAITDLSEERWKQIYLDFLRNVPLVSRLETDPAKKWVLMPIAKEQLLAGRQSTLWVDFKVDEKQGEMTLRPWEAAGSRTQLMLLSLVCGRITIPCASVATDDDGWDDNLPLLFDRSTGLRVFMQNYDRDLGDSRPRVEP